MCPCASSLPQKPDLPTRTDLSCFWLPCSRIYKYAYQEKHGLRDPSRTFAKCPMAALVPSCSFGILGAGGRQEKEHAALRHEDRPLQHLPAWSLKRWLEVNSLKRSLDGLRTVSEPWYNPGHRPEQTHADALRDSMACVRPTCEHSVPGWVHGYGYRWKQVCPMYKPVWLPNIVSFETNLNLVACCSETLHSPKLRKPAV